MMFPTFRGVHLDIDALSGIMGSISIACWLVVFSPQIIENFRRSSAEGLSISFLIIWLAGDLFNILGGVFQGVLPTMLILAIYYTLADIVLLAQVLYYNGFSLNGKKGKNATDDAESVPTETSLLIPSTASPGSEGVPNTTPTLVLPNGSSYTNGNALPRRDSSVSTHSLLHTAVDGVHLSPATPLREPQTIPAQQTHSALQNTLFNTGAVLLVCLAGIAGWYLAELRNPSSTYERIPNDSTTLNDDLEFDTMGQTFGYLCAVLYLGSRIPQILLNHRRKSTEGVSMLFFLFACIGNLTYVLSIFAYEPACAKSGRWNRKEDWNGGMMASSDSRRHVGCAQGQWAEAYGRYIWINLSWLVGSAGTLLLDLAVFAQFWMYRGNTPIGEGGM